MGVHSLDEVASLPQRAPPTTNVACGNWEVLREVTRKGGDPR